MGLSQPLRAVNWRKIAIALNDPSWLILNECNRLITTAIGSRLLVRGRLYASRKLQVEGVNFLRAYVAQHQRGIIRG